MKGRFVIGIDIGGSKIMAGLVDPKGKILRKDQRHTDTRRGKKAIMETILASIAAVHDPRVRAIGVGMAGSVDNARGRYRRGPNFPSSFRDIPMANLVMRRFGVPAVLDNDVHCFALGEALFGAGKGNRTVVGLTLGTGVGGGIVMDGEVMRGKNNTAGELGHAVIDLSGGRTCSCGKLGHLEAVASGRAMAARYSQKTKRRLAAFWDLEDRANAHERDAVAVVNEATAVLGAGIATFLHVLDPDVIVVGGGTAKIRPIWSRLKTQISRNLAYPHLSTTPIVRSTLGDSANVLGAAVLAQKTLK